MHTLKENEIKFLKDTGFSPTIVQCNEWKRIPFRCLDDIIAVSSTYNINWDEFWYNISNPEDWEILSLTDIAIYLFTIFFTKDELVAKTTEELEKFLCDWRYYSGFRKFSQIDLCKEVALKVLDGKLSIIDIKNDDEVKLAIVDKQGNFRSLLTNYEKAQ